MENKKRILPLLLALTLLAGCANSAAAPEDEAYLDRVVLEQAELVELESEAVALADAPALPEDMAPVASGTKTKKNSKAEVDYSNTQDGYVMVRFVAQTDKRLKVKVIGPTTDYQYNIDQGEWTVFPLSDGNGEYKVKVYEKKTADPADSKYATILTASFSAELTDEFAPFIRPNQYVDYGEAADTKAKAEELIGQETDPLKKVEKVYSFVVENLTYDKQKAKTVQKGYLPVLDEVLASKTGICFDYAALMTGMLRSQGVPCKLVVGYAGTAYHAWISVWTEEQGWIDGAIFFDGKSWQRMDPTFASSGKSSEAIMKYIGDGKNYTAEHLY